MITSALNISRILNSRPATQHTLRQVLAVPVDSASLAFFRISFGVIMIWEVWRHFESDWIRYFWITPSFHFSYYGLNWIRPWPGVGMELHWLALGLLAICITFGFWYRVTTVLFFVSFLYIFLLDQALYLNHFYLVGLISLLMIFIPAHRYFSIDALLRPQLRSDVVPAWSILLLRFQVGIPYFFGGIGKINADWLRGEPLRLWMARRTDFPIIGQFLTNDTVVWVLTYGTLLLDLFAILLLTNRRTRVFGYSALLIFHFMNSRFFSIGIFPWLMIVATAIFFPPGWPRRLLLDIRQGPRLRIAGVVGGFSLGLFIGGYIPQNFSWVQAIIGGLGVAIAAYHLDEPFGRKCLAPADAKTSLGGLDLPKRSGNVIHQMTSWPIALVLMWVTIQVAFPFRHFAIPGNVHWTEEGQNFAWHMMLRNKPSYGLFIVTEPSTGKQWLVNPSDYLTRLQQRRMNSRPQMIVEFSYYLEDRLRAKGYEDIEIRGLFYAALNGRQPQLLIDQNVDLTTVPYTWLGHADWILPSPAPLR